MQFYLPNIAVKSPLIALPSPDIASAPPPITNQSKMKLIGKKITAKMIPVMSSFLPGTPDLPFLILTRSIIPIIIAARLNALPTKGIIVHMPQINDPFAKPLAFTLYVLHGTPFNLSK